MRYDQNPIIFKTPLGWVGVAASEEGISRLVLPKKDRKAVERALRSSERNTFGYAAVLSRAAKFLQQYFSGESVLFDLPIDMRYYTAFQQAVWKAAAEIPFGETRSYGWIAQRIRNPKAVRAVGQAMGANPVPIIVP